MRFAEANIAICVNNTGQDAGLTRDVLRFGLYRFDLGPLQQRFYCRAEAFSLVILPNVRDMIEQGFVPS